jgi:hypothetical protein
MIGTIRRHQTWLWFFIIAAVIISFVAYFSPNRQYNNAGPDTSAVNLGSINGEPITRQQLLAAEQEGRIFMRLNTGEWPDSADKRKALESFADTRLLLISELEQYHITATSEASARYTRQLLGIKPEDVVPADKILETLKKLGQEGGVTIDDFDRFARHQAAQEYLAALVGMTGKLITPQEAEVFYRRENEPMETELVSFPATNYFSKTTVAETNIEDFYTKRQADYRVPDRIQVNYIAFDLSNYLGTVEKEQGTNLNDKVDRVYLQQGAAQFKDEAGVQLSAEAAKAKIRKQVLDYSAMSEAAKEAKNFLNDLSQGHDDQHPYTKSDLAALAKTKNLTVKTTAPFDLKSGSKELPIAPKFVRLLFQLRDDDPDDKERSELYAPLVGGEAGVYVVGFEKRIPSVIQPLSAVHEKVAADYRQSEALELAQAAGKRFEQALGAGLSQGKTFDTMCAAQFVHPRNLSPFSLTSTTIPELPDKAAFEQVMEVAAKMHPGQCSPFIPTEEGGFLLYIKQQLPVDEAVLRRDLPAFLARMREHLQIAAFNAWFNREYQLHVVLPAGDRAAAGG